MTSKTRQLIEQIATEADASADQAMPAGATAIKPNKSVTISTRLAPQDAAAIEDLAVQLGIPAAALLRGWILAELTARREESVPAALDRLTADLQRLRELVA